MHSKLSCSGVKAIRPNAASHPALRRLIHNTPSKSNTKDYDLVGALEQTRKLISELKIRQANQEHYSNLGPDSAFVPLEKLKSLDDLRLKYKDANLSQEELEKLVWEQLHQLHDQVMVRKAAFEKVYGKEFQLDPKSWPRKASNPVFLLLLMCIALFAWFLNFQYHEFAHELSFDIRFNERAAAFYFLLGLHGFHVLVGMGLMAMCAVYAWNCALSPQSMLFRFTTVYVHMVDLVFVVIVATVYQSTTVGLHELEPSEAESYLKYRKDEFYIDENAEAQLVEG
eukprot:NODE_3300_length_992_cov_684.060116_g3154_i0.p1 GENE.NODE_3300_length_992_cov_684.060116_g3154_i0~~NODE_3300_length_992_cov_684.060116_g3154_i0.p1  ORF type:complete len:304 (-),score=78.56 NODE_3300_length_992_cov_684.060116_g3154_i0:80-928(-)